jgi:hypothetical protein
LARFLGGAAACFLLLTGAFLFWQSRAAENPNSLPNAPAPRTVGASLFSAAEALEAPEASQKTREEKRFSRADKNKDGKIEEEEVLAARRKAERQRVAELRGVGRQDDWQVPRRRFGPQRLADGGGVCDHGAEAVEEATLLMLTTFSNVAAPRCIKLRRGR